MKFNEFIALEKQLEKSGLSINEIIKEVTGEYLFEEGEDKDKVDTEGDKFKRVTSPRFAKARRKLANNAKSFLKIAQEKIINKFLPKQLEQLKSIANTTMEMRANKKSPKEILTAIGGNLQKIQTIHDKSTLQIEDSIDKMEANFDKRIKSIIENEKLSEKSQLKLDTFWTLLVVQVKQILFKKIIEARGKSIEEMINQVPELKKILTKVTKLPHTEAEIEKLSKEQDKYKQDMAGSSKDSKVTMPEDGGIYQWTNDKGDVMKIKIIGKNPDVEGEWKAEITSPKGKVTETSITQKTINKNLGKKIS